MLKDIKYTNRLLVEFSSIMDIDLAVLRLVQRDYNNPEYFNLEMFEKNVPEIRAELIKREYVNPLRVIIKDKYVDDVTHLYQDMYKENYNDICDLCVPNDIFKFLLTMKRTNGLVNTTVLCESEKEKEIIQKYDIKNLFNIIISDRKSIDFNQYDCVFLNRYRDILFYDISKLGGKYIFIHRANYNLESGYKTQIPLIAISKVVGDINKVMLISPYMDFDL